jgi:hypothetical protein
VPRSKARCLARLRGIEQMAAEQLPAKGLLSRVFDLQSARRSHEEPTRAKRFGDSGTYRFLDHGQTMASDFHGALQS